MGWIPTPYIIGCCSCMSPTCVLFALLYLSLPSLSSPTTIPKHDCPQDIEYTPPPPSVSSKVVSILIIQKTPLGNACRGLFRRQPPKPLNLPPSPHLLLFLLLAPYLPDLCSLEYERRFWTWQLMPGKPVTRREQRTRPRGCVRPSLDTALVTSRLT